MASPKTEQLRKITERQSYGVIRENRLAPEPGKTYGKRTEPNQKAPRSPLDLAIDFVLAKNREANKTLPRHRRLTTKRKAIRRALLAAINRGEETPIEAVTLSDS